MQMKKTTMTNSISSSRGPSW